MVPTSSQQPNYRVRTTPICAKSKDRIDPIELQREVSIEEFNHFSNEYYRSLSCPQYKMGKPFSTTRQTARLLHHVGLVLGCLKLGPLMDVLDFGAGTCWLSKIVWQMGCNVVALDVSDEALRIGRELFESYPVPYQPAGTIDFEVFDGYRIPLKNASLDRVVCYDVFHHLPNQKQVLEEFYRILRPGGIVVFNEPLGGQHSHTKQSQKEMMEYTVLENDLHLREVIDVIESVGFENPRFKVFLPASMDFSMDEMIGIAERRELFASVVDGICDTVNSEGIFFVTKPGQPILDSRTVEGLGYEMKTNVDRVEIECDRSTSIVVSVKNVGSARWISTNPNQIGVVNIGGLLEKPDQLQKPVDLFRVRLPNCIESGEEFEIEIPLLFQERGRFSLTIDLVSERVCWFVEQGSIPVKLDVVVT